jgi:23S rRNA G2069 N7-methylase RlmK/C1962 C5-methylase RlmI
MPGLIADWYNGTLVLQCHTAGMYKERMHFVEALKDIYGDKLKAVYDKSKAALHDAVETTYIYFQANLDQAAPGDIFQTNTLTLEAFIN